jgi:hypothetical protein
MEADHKPIPIDAVAIEQVPRNQIINEIIVAAVFVSVAWATVLLRFWTRIFVVQSLGWDDWTMAMTMVGKIPFDL